MTQKSAGIVIAIDAMGGDNAPESALEGANAFLRSQPNVHFLIYGDSVRLNPLLDKLPKLKSFSTLHHTSERILGDEKPSIAIRRGRNTSMALAIHAVRSGEAHVCVSAGNTGALMALSKIMLRTLPGIERPAIGALVPNSKGASVMLDLGANVACDATNLFEFAVMGNAFAQILLNKPAPTIALLNVGSEDMKGHETVRSAAEMMEESDIKLNFIGFCEGDQITSGYADVMVTDGFTGNVALKTAEGTAKMCTSFLKEAICSTPAAKVGAWLMKPALRKFKNILDPRLHNGAMFLGLNGIVVKSHGGTDAFGFANAVKVAHELVRARINEQIIQVMVKSGHMPIVEEDLVELGVSVEPTEAVTVTAVEDEAV